MLYRNNIHLVSLSTEKHSLFISKCGSRCCSGLVGIKECFVSLIEKNMWVTRSDGKDRVNLCHSCPTQGQSETLSLLTLYPTWGSPTVKDWLPWLLLLRTLLKGYSWIWGSFDERK